MTEAVVQEPGQLPSLTVGTERFRDTVREAIPLIRAHGEEIGMTVLPERFQPDLNLYAAMEKNGHLLWITVRRDGALVGYAMLIGMPSFPFAGQKHGDVEAIFLIERERHGWTVKRLLEEVERQARAHGIKHLTLNVWAPQHRFSQFLEILGWEGKQTTHWKFLG